VADVISAVDDRKEFERVGDQDRDPVECPGSPGAEERLEFGKRLFDRIEVGTIGREKPDVRADGFDRSTDLELFVDDEVIEDDDIAGAERRHEDLFDVGKKAHIIDRAIEDRRGADPIGGQGGDHGRRLPMTAARVLVQPGATRTATVAAQEIGGDAALVEKYVLAGVVHRQRVTPRAALRRDISPSLFVGVYGFFLP
jgi:hypothetical protein